MESSPLWHYIWHVTNACQFGFIVAVQRVICDKTTKAHTYQSLRLSWRRENIFSKFRLLEPEAKFRQHSGIRSVVRVIWSDCDGWCIFTGRGTRKSFEGDSAGLGNALLSPTREFKVGFFGRSLAIEVILRS